MTDEASYRQAAHGVDKMRLLTEDELLQRSRHLIDELSAGPRGGIFSLLAVCANETLTFKQGIPYCKLERMLDWRELTLALGQDLFTCAGLAAKDVQGHCESRSFLWPAIILTDHPDLQLLLSQGISENHYHLNGSTQIFALTWSFLMNHPTQIKPYFNHQRFESDLHPWLSSGERNNRFSWYELISIAAFIRAALFSWLMGLWSQERVLKEYLTFYYNKSERSRTLFARIESLRLSYGLRLLQRGEKRVRLDYAITQEFIPSDLEKSPFRLLAGERAFLYRCFVRGFREECAKPLGDMLYLYLLIKARFRSELIQTNGRHGFRNFADYQDRKALLWGDRDEYWEESYRLSIGAAFSQREHQEPNLRSLELRIMPMNDANALKRNVWSIDQSAEALLESMRPESAQPVTCPHGKSVWLQRQEKASLQAPYFYVLHFAKNPLLRLGSGHGRPYLPRRPRNADVRRAVEQQARGTARALGYSSYLCSRIRGIDACNHEIGCRPETFATAFRYLRGFCPKIIRDTTAPRYWPRLSATYHAGEDFLDIADGLRAIDEAVCFLNLERGDRLGHALALGVSPAQYYRVKGGTVAMPAQDLLDNLTWLLFRSLEWGVKMPDQQRALLEQLAEQLLRNIYDDSCEDASARYDFTLRDYYQSWQLRGDDPHLYENVYLQTAQEFLRHVDHHYRNVYSDYRRAMLDDRLKEYTWLEEHSEMQKWLNPREDEATTDLRASRKLQLLLHRYHFGMRERYRGQRIEFFNVDQAYWTLMESMQNKMMEKLMRKDIAIECNPSSNHLIGTFDRYELHPIFRFNSFNLPESVYPSQTNQMKVSVNTDDLGVFDTSLENEYGLLWSCLQLHRDEENRPLIDDDTISIYLDHLREMSNSIVFPKSISSLQNRSHT